MTILQKSMMKDIPPRIVPTLVFFNGLVNIFLFPFPVEFSKIPYVYKAAQVFNASVSSV